MSKSILFPTDFSACADCAFEYALHLARSMKARIITLHVYENLAIAASHMRNTMAEIVEQNEMEALENFKDVTRLMRQQADAKGFRDVELTHVMKTGERVVPTILAAEREENPDFIVMGTTGAGWLKKLFTGSVASEVMENAKTPVLSVPEEVRFDGQIDDIAFATTFTGIDGVALDQVIALTEPFQARIHCLNVASKITPEIQATLKSWQDSYAATERVTFTLEQANSVQDTIIAFLDKNNVDILTTIIHKRNIIQELFDHSLTKKLSYHLKYPILSFQARQLQEQLG